MTDTLPNKENIQKWVDALRSGDYQQGNARLRTLDNQFCCLGVACDVSGLGEFQADTDFNSIPYVLDGAKETAFLPRAVVEWLGLVPEGGPSWGNVRFAGTEATYANDTLGWTFNEIADAIEKEYLNA